MAQQLYEQPLTRFMHEGDLASAIGRREGAGWCAFSVSMAARAVDWVGSIVATLPG